MSPLLYSFYVNDMEIDLIYSGCQTYELKSLNLYHFQQYFSYIMATSFSGGGSRSTRREPPTMGKQLVNFITCGCESSAPFLLCTKPGANTRRCIQTFFVGCGQALTQLKLNKIRNTFRSYISYLSTNI
jgi:hypothetical protein